MRRIFTIAAACFLCATTVACGEKEPKKPVVIQPGGGNESGGSTGSDIKVGSVIPAWEKGEFDIHFINTTAGECIFLIFPDGTQMLVDAAGSTVATGAVSSTTNTGIRSRWDPTANGQFLCGDFISRYIKECQKWTGNSNIDYMLLTHFHNDHFGGANGLPASANSSTYTKQSMPLILDNFSVGKLMDRGWPDYDYPFDMLNESTNAANCKNYVNAVKWHKEHKGLNVERFAAGSDTQITQVLDAASYPTFRVRNLAVNGEVWSGSGSATVKTFPEKKDIVVSDPKNVTSQDKCPAENHLSAALKFSYGQFDFFTGGDLQYNGVSSFKWKDIETPVAEACGAVDVMKADHHGSTATNGFGKSSALAMKYLNPACWVVNSWNDIQPRQDTFEGVTNYIPALQIFITNTCSAMQSYKNFGIVKGSNGHIVVRVVDGGKKYYVMTLSDSDEKMTVKQLAGPYSSR